MEIDDSDRLSILDTAVTNAVSLLIPRSITSFRNTREETQTRRIFQRRRRIASALVLAFVARIGLHSVTLLTESGLCPPRKKKETRAEIEARITAEIT